MGLTTLITFIVYLIGMLVIGVIMYRMTNNLSDYVLGGRNLGPGVAALSAGASDMSGWLLLGLPGAIYASGMSEAWMAIGLATGAYLNWQFVAKRLRIYTEVSNNAITIPDFLENRFKDKSHILRVISALVILLFFTFYTSSGMVAGAKLFEASFGLSYQSALWIGTIVVVSYTLLGGFLAVAWTDFIQGILMFLALIAVPIVALNEMGGWSAAVQAVGEIEPSHLNMVKGVGIMAIISSLAWGLGYFGQPHIIVRFMALRSAKDVPKAKFIGTAWMILGLYGAIFTGFIGLAFISTQEVPILGKFGIDVVNEGGLQMLADPEKIFIAFSQILFHPVIAGILLAAILSAIMSTIDSQLLVSSSAVAEDFYKAIFRKKASGKELVWVGRIATLGIALIAAIIAMNPESSVLELVSYAWAGFGAAFGPIILLSLFWRGITRNGALAGIIVGAVTVIIWGEFLSGGIFDLYEIVPGFLLNLLVTILISMFGKPAPEIEAEFTETLTKLKE
ncbi:sodium/proline symporter PutP [Virgibacillus halodenitrificans]|uniref:Sodium/proline symporter n=1 Tax=Virgibacillus halodenitrificans TaxID=1482 RepID=A0ABR7VPN0_VIRHA|nr:sodium/proline symporter PutP [Virgibacillus halodenitrificans]MBD1223613.1 sodium/proline symporter PutP [Virgibacillus halodenitrificans]MYL58548.1 sodium/proline symporter PutP [Virgibacillus halodenitrificans]WHX25041.1 sodium/proline symporter PutP [Virgibacillus halodenitrificans]CDQ36791.1 Propionate transporter [Virgibacillus halodenitrificans]